MLVAPSTNVHLRWIASAPGCLRTGAATTKHNYVDHTLTTQSSILTLIEDNWSLPRISGSFDAISGTLQNLFDFHSSHGSSSKLYLDPVTGERFGR